jgi:hypothetical protein
MTSQDEIFGNLSCMGPNNPIGPGNDSVIDTLRVLDESTLFKGVLPAFPNSVGFGLESMSLLPSGPIPSLIGGISKPSKGILGI